MGCICRVRGKRRMLFGADTAYCFVAKQVFHFGHCRPVTLRHMPHTASEILSALDGGGIVKSAPEILYHKLVWRNWRKLVIGVWHHMASASVVNKNGLVCAVDYHIVFVWKTGFKMLENDRKHNIFRLNLRNKNAVIFGKTDEAAKEMAFIFQGENTLVYVVHSP